MLIGIEASAVFAPSLHLNVGNDYFALGRFAEVERHARVAEDELGRLDTGPLSAMIRRGVVALRERATKALGDGGELPGP